MSQIKYINTDGDFSLDSPQLNSGLYFPLVNEAGMMSSVTPSLGGDSKTGQNSFLLSPVSIENLHNDRSSRALWCVIKGEGVWSATGGSAQSELERFSGDEETVLEGGMLWQRVIRRSRKYGLEAEVLSFVPSGDDTLEVMQVTIRNTGKRHLAVTPVSAIPMYCRSADNIRDHRHVTTLLGRIKTTDCGVEVRPTLTFDERGHLKGTHVYGVYGRMNGQAPVGFYPLTSRFIGEGGSLSWPKAIVTEEVACVKSGFAAEGEEALGGIVFGEVQLAPGKEIVCCIAMSIDSDPQPYLTAKGVAEALKKTRRYWSERVGISLATADDSFDCWSKWVCIQPTLRRICGCSFMPHHDYGRGGRGWRDLWQDCLSLTLTEPESVRDILLNNFGGVRIDGSNATIIGRAPGEFIADRNNIVRLWMDHGVWPFITTELYVNQTGDYELLLEKQGYFKDRISCRGDEFDLLWHDEDDNILLTRDDKAYCGTILEHMLVQHVTAYFDVGDHGHIRLRGADWNDALDMAREKGESVAFTAAYAGNLDGLARLIEGLQMACNVNTVEIASELSWLLRHENVILEKPEDKRLALREYCRICAHEVAGVTVSRTCTELAALLRQMADNIRRRIRASEWVSDGKGNSWFNSYYDNRSSCVEGVRGERVRMMLTGQVFAILSGTAEQQQVRSIISAADRYLYDGECGGYRLNTNFGDDIPELGRMFGFAYGHKENGAVFSHMAIMYAYSLYCRGFAREGWKALSALYKQSAAFDRSRIYPALPEYFDPNGRGLYNYLTGSASWYMLTLQTRSFGVRGEGGDLRIQPQLVAEQFDENNAARITTSFAGRTISVKVLNGERKEYGSYSVLDAEMDGKRYIGDGAGVTIPREAVEAMPEDIATTITVSLR